MFKFTFFQCTVPKKLVNNATMYTKQTFLRNIKYVSRDYSDRRCKRKIEKKTVTRLFSRPFSDQYKNCSS